MYYYTYCVYFNVTQYHHSIERNSRAKILTGCVSKIIYFYNLFFFSCYLHEKFVRRLKILRDNITLD